MSATLNSFGLRPVYNNVGVVRARAYPNPWASGFATNLYQGTPVAMATTGLFVIAANAADFIGTFDGVEYTDSNGRRQFSKYWPSGLAATEIIAYVYDDPNTIFEVQAEGTLPQTSVGDQANFSVAGGRAVGDGNTIPGTSTMAVSITLAGAGAQGMVKILGLAPYVDNAWGDAYTILQVQIARHQYVANKVAV